MAWLAETGADATRLNPNGTHYGLRAVREGGGLSDATILEQL